MPSKDELYRGDGTGKFTSVELPDQHNPLTSTVDVRMVGVVRRGYDLCPADYDDDGDIDLFMNNYGAGRPAMDSPPTYWDWNILWRNEGGMSFVDLSEVSQVHATTRGIGGVQEETPVVIGGTTFPGPIGGNGFGCHWGDFDNDGDLDFFMPQSATGRLFENKAAQNNALVIETVAKAPRDSTGTRVTMRTFVGQHVREVIGGSGHYNTQASRKLYFGLGSDTGAKDVTIRWPNGEVQQLGNVKANYQLRVTQGGDIAVIAAPSR